MLKKMVGDIPVNRFCYDEVLAPAEFVEMENIAWLLLGLMTQVYEEPLRGPTQCEMIYAAVSFLAFLRSAAHADRSIRHLAKHQNAYRPQLRCGKLRLVPRVHCSHV